MWVISPKKFTKVELLQALVQVMSESFPVIDALNKESLELFGVEWQPKDDSINTYIDHDNLEKGTTEQYDQFFDKWHAALPFDPLHAALKAIGCEPLEATASAFCSHCCMTAYQCAGHFKDELEEELRRDPSA